MRTGPHAVVAKDMPVTFQAAADLPADDDDDNPQYSYYESSKILGKLFRAIDERKAFSDIQEGSSHASGMGKAGHSVLGALWAYVQQHCQVFEWEHHLERARAIRDEYVHFLVN